MAITWTCDGCDKPIADGEGYIAVAYSDIRKTEEAREAWERANPGPMFTGAALMAYPKDARWHALHRDCDPLPDAADYWFGVERLRTIRHALDWTLHLMEKVWLPCTDWVAFLRRVVKLDA